MNETLQDTGVITVLLQRFESQNLPKLLALKDKVELGDSLNNIDVIFMKEIASNFEEIKPLLSRHPKFEPLVTKAIQLYTDIMNVAMDNEQDS